MKLAIAMAILILSQSAAGAPLCAQTPAATKQDREALQDWLGIMSLSRPGLHDLASWTASEKRIAEEHFAWVKSLVDSRIMVLVGRTQEVDARGHLSQDEMGLLIFRAASREEAQRIISESPGVRGGLWNIRLREYKIGSVQCP